MKLTFDIKDDHVWHLFFSAQCCWIPSYPPPNPRKEGRKLKKLVHHNGCKIQMPTQEKSEFIADLWFNHLENDDCVYEMMKYCRRNFNSMSFSAQLTLEDVDVDPQWEFPMAYWRWNDGVLNRCCEYPDFTQTYISPEEAELLLRCLSKEDRYFVALAILECRERQLPAGCKRTTITNSLENDWNESIFERWRAT